MARRAPTARARARPAPEPPPPAAPAPPVQDVAERRAATFSTVTVTHQGRDLLDELRTEIAVRGSQILPPALRTLYAKALKDANQRGKVTGYSVMVTLCAQYLLDAIRAPVAETAPAPAEAAVG